MAVKLGICLLLSILSLNRFVLTKDITNKKIQIERNLSETSDDESVNNVKLDKSEEINTPIDPIRIMDKNKTREDGIEISPRVLIYETINRVKSHRTIFDEEEPANITKGNIKVEESDLKASGSDVSIKTAKSLLDATSGEQYSSSHYYHTPIYEHQYSDQLHGGIGDYSLTNPAGYNDGYSTHGDSEGSHQSSQGDDVNRGYSDISDQSIDNERNYQAADEEAEHSVGGSAVADTDSSHHLVGDHEAGSLGDVGHDLGSHGQHSKGHQEEVFDNVHRKIEYGFAETFGDDDGASSGHEADEDLSTFFDEGDKQNFDTKSTFHGNSHDDYGTAGQNEGGNYDDSNEGFESVIGEDGHFEDNNSAGHLTDSYIQAQHDDIFKQPLHFSTPVNNDRYDSTNDKNKYDTSDDNNGYDTSHDNYGYDTSDDINYAFDSSDDNMSDPDKSFNFEQIYPHGNAMSSIEKKFDDEIPLSFTNSPFIKNFGG